MTMLELMDLWGPAQPFTLAGPIGGRVRLYGFSVRETTGAAGAQVLITNAPNGGGLEMLSIGLGAGQTVREWFGPNGVILPNGYFPSITGAVAGTAFLRLMGEGGL